ncbi:hypothetical protein [Nonomuraea sp. NPDC050783]|uniref:hypothetical protein n=1 Tax=Nonomuraea sp. NPDC050783 TaxID=3154634 RepID=UPI003465F4A6
MADLLGIQFIGLDHEVDLLLDDHVVTVTVDYGDPPDYPSVSDLQTGGSPTKADQQPICLRST